MPLPLSSSPPATTAIPAAQAEEKRSGLPELKLQSLRGKRADPVPAKAARDYLRNLMVGHNAGIRRITTDRYERTLAELFVSGSNVQQQLIAARHAEIYWKYAHQCPWAR
jgi:endonuclease YncB( thermonuclease family)